MPKDKHPMHLANLIIRRLFARRPDDHTLIYEYVMEERGEKFGLGNNWGHDEVYEDAAIFKM